ncbi:26S proteasome subunit P45 [Aspergillus heteromorphus CBS 117.55]|uniref:26S proteasome regulatory subunit 4 homolog n=2 Tax=Aspergillaceae TaxID=1131492 RepID=A0A317VXG9_9EURO|nr:26S proteasome subunit P45 [Aspergillus heteromorphus CBS 117.55]PWY79126.1 26S proteasome subunit P45 [Aspergillus heteromorphus CBS 117.55]
MRWTGAKAPADGDNSFPAAQLISYTPPSSFIHPPSIPPPPPADILAPPGYRIQSIIGNQQSNISGGPGGDGANEKDKKKDKPKYEPPPPPTTRIGRKKRRAAGPSTASKLPDIYPTSRCKLRYLRMQRVHDHLLLEEEYVENMERLRKTKAQATLDTARGDFDIMDRNADERGRVDDMRGSPMGVGNLEELIDDDHAIVSSATGPEYYVSIMSFVDKDLLEPGASILLHHKSVSVVGVLTEESDPLVSVMKLDKAPTESYADIGGLETQIQEVRESVELPLLHPELYEEMGIKPPKGVILYGAPGTGKTLLAKAVANQTSATFLRIVGSELIQKYLGDGPRLVRQIFQVAAEHAPSIVFIDEIDAIGTKRYDSTSGGEREIQRTMLELLNQLDGFDDRGDVKVIMATNKIETLDPALIRPGRIDRKILFENPDQNTKKKIFTLHTSKMSLGDDVDLDEFINQKDDLSGADIRAICTEAGLMALRERRMRVQMDDFRAARERIMKTKQDGGPVEGLYLANIDLASEVISIDSPRHTTFAIMDGFDEEAFKKFFPTSFGRQEKKADVSAQIDRTKRTEVSAQSDREAALVGDASAEVNAESEKERQPDGSGSDSGSDDSDDDSDDDEDEFPVSHELTFKTHDRAVTTLTADPSGSRLITGSTDCTIKLHDFASMTPSTVRAFKSVDPSAKKQSAAQEAHAVHYAAFNPLAPAYVLVVSATSQPRILDRDGETVTEFAKGDMYLRDLHNTKGHISEVTSGAWCPTDENLCATAGTDSTVRIWDANNGRSQKEVIVHKSRVAGSAGRTKMTAVAWGSPKQGGPNVLVSAALDGSLVMWSGNGPFTRPSAEVRDAHTRDTWTSGIDISSDGRLVITKGGDDTIKLWDTRKFKQPITTIHHPSSSSRFPSSNIVFSPTSANVLTGSETGHLHILNPATLKPELITPVTPGSPLISVIWHEKMNQIITGSANAETHVLYNPTMSTKGAALVMSKAPKRRHIDDDPSLTMDLTQGISGDSVVVGSNGVPHYSSATWSARHPNVGLTASGRSRDPRRPHIPAQTPFAKSQPDERHIRENIPLSSMRDEDPREALLKYAEKAEKDPIFTKAWKETQPTPIYRDLSDEEDEPGPDKKKARR